MVTPTARRLAVGVLCADFPVSLSRACTALGVARSSWRYVSRRDDGPLRAALRDVAHCRPRFGYRRLHVLLQRAGWRCNHKRVYRLYREERLAVRRRRRRKLAAGCRIVLPVPTRPHERWSMDFMGDTLANGRTFRTFNLVDDGSRECLAIEVDHGLSGQRVARILDRIAAARPLPKQIVVDNGPEFTSPRSMRGRTRMASSSTSSDPVNLWTMPSSNRSTASSATSASTSTGFSISTMRARRSRRGGSTITRCAPIARSGTAPQRSTLPRQD